MTPGPSRRHCLQAGAGLLLLPVLRPAGATSRAVLAPLVQQWAGGRPVTEGRVWLEAPPLVENGNTVPISVRVDSPMTAAAHVQEIVLYNSGNPQREVLRAQLTPACGVPELHTRIRLATTQYLVALARLSDGTQWSHHVEVLVTLAACIEN